MTLKTLLTAFVACGLAAGSAYAQAGSGASAPVTPPTTATGPVVRTPNAGDTSGRPVRPIRRRRATFTPAPSNENGPSPDRAAAAGGGR